MALSLFTKNMSIIALLPDEPNDVGGLSAEQLKEKFDEGGEALKEYLNKTLIPEVEAAIEAAALGIPSGGGIDGRIIVDGSIDTNKYAAGSVNELAVANGAITGSKVADRAITGDKVARASIGRENLTEDAIMLQSTDFPNKVVPGRALEDNTIIFTKYGDGSITSDKVNADSRTQYFPAELSVSGWEGTAAPYTQTVNVGGMNASDIPKVYLVPPETFADVEAAEEAYGLLYDVNSGNGTATFKAKEKPAVAINVALEVSRI